MEYLIEERIWDSDLFGKKTALLQCVFDQKGSLNFEDLISKIKAENYELIYYFLENGALENLSISDMAKLGFEKIDTQLDFEVNLSRLNFDVFKSDSRYNLKLINHLTPYLEDKLVKISEQLVKVSRFAKDKRIEYQKVLELYRLWIKNSFSGKDNKGVMADYVYVISEGNGDSNNSLNPEVIRGFLTLKEIKKKGLVNGQPFASKKIDISLIVVDKNCQGQGIGEQMIFEALKKMKSLGFEICGVRVSLLNIPAVRFYEKIGFRMRSSREVYHAHYKK